MRLAWRPNLGAPPRPINMGVIAAVLLASLAAGFVGGFVVWALWRYDLLNLGDRRRDP
jgi:hypothetical protein